MADVRGRAADRVRTWTHGQTLAREHYRVVVGSDATASSQEREVAALLAPNDEMFCVPHAVDAELWNAGASRAGTQWLVFTEGHCLAHPGCLEAVARWIAANPNAEVGNFTIDHDDDKPLAKLNRRWFGMIEAQWNAPGQWPRVHRSGFAIRTDVFRKVGGFEGDYSQFAPQLLSAHLHLRGIRVEAVPGASIFHEDDERMRDHHEATSDFVRGLIEARSRNDPAFFERYFGHGPILANYPFERTSVARQVARAIAAVALSNPRLAARLAFQMRPLAAALIAGPTARIMFHSPILPLEDAAIERLPLPAGWRWMAFLRSHQRATRLEYLKQVGARGLLRELPPILHQCPIEGLGPETIVGVHGLEEYQGRRFRWTEPFAILRPQLSESENELWIETRNLRGDPLSSLIAVILDGSVLPRRLLAATTDGTLIVRLPASFAAAAQRGIIFVFSALKPERHGSLDRRSLGLPIFSVANVPWASQER